MRPVLLSSGWLAVFIVSRCENIPDIKVHFMSILQHNVARATT
jgi:hypothetical protein